MFSSTQRVYSRETFGHVGLSCIPVKQSGEHACVYVQVMVGELPGDFLRVTSSVEQQQIAADRQTAAYLQSGGGMPVFAPASRLSITVAQVTE